MTNEKSDRKVPMADLVARIASLESPLLEAMERVVRSGRYILGPEVKALEEEIAALCGARHGIGVSSGTDALLVAMMALGIGPGDEVVTTPLSFFASAGCILRLGARPVFADIEPETFNLSVERVAEKVSERTRAIEVVHLFGQCGDVEGLVELARPRGAAVIEDAAQALGSRRGGGSAGGTGTVGCFSFFPTKNLGALGDGGMVVTGDDELAELLRVYRAHGARPKYYHHHVGGNFRLDEIQAALLRVMLPSLGAWNERRRANASRYDALLDEAGLVAREIVVPPARVGNGYHIFHHYVVRIPRGRDALQEHLAKRGISTAVYYPTCLHLQPCVANLGYREGDFPVAEAATREALALPVHPELAPEQIERVVEEMRTHFS